MSQEQIFTVRDILARTLLLSAAVEAYYERMETTGESDLDILRVGLFASRAEPARPTAADVVEACTATAPSTDVCSVCLEDYGAKTTVKKCGHAFHMHCIGKWVDTGKRSCPVCRGGIFE